MLESLRFQCLRAIGSNVLELLGPMFDSFRIQSLRASGSMSESCMMQCANMFRNEPLIRLQWNR